MKRRELLDDALGQREVFALLRWVSLLWEGPFFLEACQLVISTRSENCGADLPHNSITLSLTLSLSLSLSHPLLLSDSMFRINLITG